MITVNKYDTISRETFLQECLTSNGASYIVSGIEVEDLFGNINNLNDFLVDNMVENGYLLGDVKYQFVGHAGTNGTAKIQVNVGHVKDYVQKDIDI